MSTHTSPEKQDVVLSDQPDSSNAEPEPETDLAEDMDEPKCSDRQEQGGAQYSGVDCIVDEQISGFFAEVEDLLREERVYYIPFSSCQSQRNPPQSTMVPFSEYVSHFNTPIPMHSYVKSFRDSVNAYLVPWRNRQDSGTLVSSSVPAPARSAAAAFTFNSSTLREDHQQHLHDTQMINGSMQAEQSMGMAEHNQGKTSNSSISSWGISDAGESMANSRAANNDTTTPIEPAPTAFSNVISQLQPEVINTLMEIVRDVQKNTNHFFIHCVDEESDVCWEIKVQHVMS